MDRRVFVAGSLALLAAPLAAETQPARVYRVGVVHQGGAYSKAVVGLREALKELGFEEGKQVILDVHDVQGDLKSVEVAAKTLEAAKVDLIVSVSSSTTLAVKRATQSMPIVFYAGSNPVNLGDWFRASGSPEGGSRVSTVSTWTSPGSARSC